MIVNVRGTNGSGKSYVQRRLRDEHPHELVVEPTRLREKNFKKPNATLVEGGLILVGRELTSCDGIFPQEIIEDMLRHWAPRGHLVWDNVLVSGNVGRWADLSDELAPINPSVWAQLTTPVDLCLERIYSRRAEATAAGYKHKNETIKEDVVQAHWRRCRRSAGRAFERGMDLRWLDHERSYELVHDLLVRAGWECREHGLLLPDGPFLDPWQPGEGELERLIKTACLPHEDPPAPRHAPRPVTRRNGMLANVASDLEEAPRTGAASPREVAAGMMEPERDVLSDPFLDLGELLGH